MQQFSKNTQRGSGKYGDVEHFDLMEPSESDKEFREGREYAVIQIESLEDEKDKTENERQEDIPIKMPESQKEVQEEFLCGSFEIEVNESDGREEDSSSESIWNELKEEDPIKQAQEEVEIVISGSSLSEKGVTEKINQSSEKMKEEANLGERSSQEPSEIKLILNKRTQAIVSERQQILEYKHEVVVSEEISHKSSNSSCSSILIQNTTDSKEPASIKKAISGQIKACFHSIKDKFCQKSIFDKVMFLEMIILILNISAYFSYFMDWGLLERTLAIILVPINGINCFLFEMIVEFIDENFRMLCCFLVIYLLVKGKLRK